MSNGGCARTSRRLLAGLWLGAAVVAGCSQKTGGAPSVTQRTLPGPRATTTTVSDRIGASDAGAADSGAANSGTTDSGGDVSESADAASGAGRPPVAAEANARELTWAVDCGGASMRFALQRGTGTTELPDGTEVTAAITDDIATGDVNDDGVDDLAALLECTIDGTTTTRAGVQVWSTSNWDDIEGLAVPASAMDDLGGRASLTINGGLVRIAGGSRNESGERRRLAYRVVDGTLVETDPDSVPETPTEERPTTTAEPVATTTVIPGDGRPLIASRTGIGPFSLGDPADAVQAAALELLGPSDDRAPTCSLEDTLAWDDLVLGFQGDRLAGFSVGVPDTQIRPALARGRALTIANGASTGYTESSFPRPSEVDLRYATTPGKPVRAFGLGLTCNRDADPLVASLPDAGVSASTLPVVDTSPPSGL